MWDLMAITTYLLCSTMYLFLPLIPDLAMARDRTQRRWLKTFYKILALGFRGTEGEWKNLTTAMNIFAFAIIPVMFSVHTIVSWDFAMAQALAGRPCIWSLLCDRRLAFRHGSGSDRLVPATLHDETLQIFHPTGTLRYDGDVDAAGLHGLGVFLLQ